MVKSLAKRSNFIYNKGSGFTAKMYFNAYLPPPFYCEEKKIMFHIVLVEPEIPQNAGNIARTCAATGTHLHMIRPLGFEVTDKYLKRAGLDYWHLVDISYYDSFDELKAKYPDGRFFYLTTKGRHRHSDVGCFVQVLRCL